MRKYIALSILLGGCMMGPDYTPPLTSVNDEWVSDAEAFSAERPLEEWWSVFEDPLLTSYMQKAAQQNNDLQVALQNIQYARAIRQTTASTLFPQIGADLNATKSYFSKNGPLFANSLSTDNLPGSISPGTGLPFGVQTPQIQSLFNALFDFSWEIDLFGKTRRAVESADAQIGSSQEKMHDTLISLYAEVARNFLEVRSAQKRGLLLAENIDLLESRAVIVKAQWDAGYADRLSYESIETQLAQGRALLPEAQAEIYRGIYALSVLIGEPPEFLLQEMLPLASLPQPPEKVLVGLRSDLLRRRPDVRGAERNLAAATAQIGVAKASFFPTITLLGDGGLQSLSIRNLFTASSRTWAIGGDALIPIFQGGKLIGNLHAAEASAAAACYVYQQVVLKALEEAESRLTTYSHDQRTQSERLTAVERQRTLVGLSADRQEKGLVDLPSLLLAQQQLNEAERQLLDSEIKTLLDLVSLYKALGGGWQQTSIEGE